VRASEAYIPHPALSRRRRGSSDRSHRTSTSTPSAAAGGRHVHRRHAGCFPGSARVYARRDPRGWTAAGGDVHGGRASRPRAHRVALPGGRPHAQGPREAGEREATPPATGEGREAPGRGEGASAPAQPAARTRRDPFAQIRANLRASGLSAEVAERAIAIFRLPRSRRRSTDASVETVSFHELGGWTHRRHRRGAALIAALPGATRSVSTPPLGRGRTKTAWPAAGALACGLAPARGSSSWMTASQGNG
jgi:hypothetical protein